MQMSVCENPVMVLPFKELQAFTGQGKKIRELLGIVRELEGFVGKKAGLPYIYELDIKKGTVTYRLTVKQAGVGYHSTFEVELRNHKTGKTANADTSHHSLGYWVEMINGLMKQMKA
ncbi:hypothetical protein [Bacillus thuringiensis]|uniref:hypothetical protein n=1 Tax=Bacillus thuringiensis TaxID=1428 RepID=UPI000BFB9312|nr:hypothetical protein [Bacillus thuringiensis]PGT89847.1 hypothetical protein COD17_08850 [Bacillus thuringiensis]